MAVLRSGNPDRICLHHSAVSPGAKDKTALKAKLAGFERYHAQKSWANTIKTLGEYGYEFLEYHAAIARNGHEIRTQDDKYVLYHAGDNFRGKDSFNLHGIGLLVDGNFETEDYTPEQLEGVARYIARFEKKYKVNVIVRGHKETSKSPTACPGRNLGTHDSGFMKKAIARANEIIAKNLPTNPIQDDPQGSSEVERLKQEILDLKKGVVSLLKEKEALESKLELCAKEKTDIKGKHDLCKDDLKACEEKYATLMIEKKTLANTCADMTQKYNQLKGNRFMWLVEWLEKVIPKSK